MFQLKFSILQIYKEVVYDLLTGERDLKIKESPIKGVYVEGLSEVYVDSKNEFLELIDIAQQQKFVAGTKLNNNSSRSHSIFILEITQLIQSKNIQKKGSLYLVDLAGSEKVSKTGAVGETLEEAKKINLSLSALGMVINAITSNSDHIPFRDSKLTRILRESLGGNYKTSFIVTCSPHSSHFEESVSSLKFAQRVKTIKNKVKMNIKLTYDELQKTINNLKFELTEAKKEISVLKSNFEDDKTNLDKKIDTNDIYQENEISKFSKSNLLVKCKLDNEKSKYFCPNCNQFSKVKNDFNNLEDINSNLNKFLIKFENKEIDDKNLKEIVENFQSKVKELEIVERIKENEIKKLQIKMKESEEKNRKLLVSIYYK